MRGLGGIRELLLVGSAMVSALSLERKADMVCS
jgi:hypothetical protein